MVRGHKSNASFRDPDGFLFEVEETIFRQVNLSYKENFDLLMESGLYTRLVKEKLLIPHSEVNNSQKYSDSAYKVIKPLRIPFISYPYEWSFSQLKDAAFLTLQIERVALEFGMSLKDASAFNVQFLEGKPIFIDTLSFEKYKQDRPWVAYKQFCQHFLGPLALMSKKDIYLNKLSTVFLDGTPLKLVSTLLPWKTRLNLGLLVHIHLHASMQEKYSGKGVKKVGKFSKQSFLGLLDNLESTVKGLSWTPKGTEWGDYYSNTNYKRTAFKQKAALIEKYLTKSKPKFVWDLGANTGEFSRIASKKGIETIASDIDPAAVELNYRIVKEKSEKNILPLQIDLVNPSPGLGWRNLERDPFSGRGLVDCILALALIHHLTISNNIPLELQAEFFSSLSKYLIIEFVPKQDSQVQKLLSTRTDIFQNYTEEGFEKAFTQFYKIIDSTKIKGSQRSIYLLESLNAPNF